MNTPEKDAAPLPQAEHSPQTAAVWLALTDADQALADKGFRADSLVRESIAKDLAALAAPQSGGQPPAAVPGLSDDEIDALWLYRKKLHNGYMLPQLRDFARAVLALATSEPAVQPIPPTLEPQQ